MFPSPFFIVIYLFRFYVFLGLMERSRCQEGAAASQCRPHAAKTKKNTHDISEEWLLAAGSDQRRGSALTAAESLTLMFVSLSRTYLRSCSSSCSPSGHSGAFNCCGDVRRGTEHPCAPRRVCEIEAIS